MSKKGVRVDFEILKMAIDDIVEASYNPRMINSEAFDGLKRSLIQFGLYSPLVWNRKTRRLVAGHQRLRALRELGVEKVPVVVVDLDEKREIALNITDNNPLIQGYFTDDLFALTLDLDEEDMQTLRIKDLVEIPETVEHEEGSDRKASLNERPVEELSFEPLRIRCPKCGHEFKA